MSTEMVRRVARALASRCDGDPLNWEGEARTAIAAMLEPTDEMYHALCATNKMWRDLTSEIVWETYITAAAGPEYLQIIHPQKPSYIQFGP